MSDDLNVEFQKMLVAQKTIDSVLELQSQLSRAASGQPLLRRPVNTEVSADKPKPLSNS
jgi:hypothetical protein